MAAGIQPQICSITVDDEEHKFYSSASVRWWNSFGSLHNLNGQILKDIKNVLQDQGYGKEDNGTFTVTQNTLVLDAGCGGGILSEPLDRAGCTVVGVDVNESLINVAKDHAKLDLSLSKLTYTCEAIEAHALNNIEKYDIVVLNFVLQHAKHHEVLINACVQSLKPGGVIFVSAVGKTFIAWLRIFLGQHVFRYMQRGAHNWNNFILCQDTETILMKNQCVVNGVKGLYYNIFSSSWKWCNNTDGFYAMHAIKKL